MEIPDNESCYIKTSVTDCYSRSNFAFLFWEGRSNMITEIILIVSCVLILYNFVKQILPYLHSVM